MLGILLFWWTCYCMDYCRCYLYIGRRISELAAEMKERGKNHDATIKKCVDDYRATLKEINAKNTLNTYME